jgi:NAD dependent epimerase/dehydratase family
MRILVAGASAAIGTRLAPQLIERRDEVLGTHSSPGDPEPLHLDLRDRDAVTKPVVARRPDAIVHHATALADLSDFKHFDRSFRHTNLLRTRGHGRADRGCTSGGCHALRRPERRQRAPRAQRSDGDAVGPAASVTTGLAMSSAAPESLLEKQKRTYQV